MYVAPPGKEIIGIGFGTEDGYRFDWEEVDHHPEPHTVSRTWYLRTINNRRILEQGDLTGPERSLRIIGDIKGDDVKNGMEGTHVVVEFWPLHIYLIDK